MKGHKETERGGGGTREKKNGWGRRDGKGRIEERREKRADFRSLVSSQRNRGGHGERESRGRRKEEEGNRKIERERERESEEEHGRAEIN